MLERACEMSPTCERRAGDIYGYYVKKCEHENGVIKRKILATGMYCWPTTSTPLRYLLVDRCRELLRQKVSPFG